MKKVRRIVCLVVVVACIFTTMGIAYAVEYRNSPKVYWDKPTCPSYFYTGTTYKTATYFWEDFTVKATFIDYTPNRGQVLECLARPYSSTGLIMGPEYGCMETYPCNIPNTAYGGENYVKVRIKNYYSSYGDNMDSEGYFYGSYS